MNWKHCGVLSIVYLAAAVIGILFFAFSPVAFSFGSEPKEDFSATGKVIMTRERQVTIRMDEGQPNPGPGDTVELSFSAGGEVIPLGIWRVSRVNDDGTVEADPQDIVRDPSIGLDARIRLQNRNRAEPAGQSGKSSRPAAKTAGGVNRKKARYEEQCAQGHADACNNLGVMYYSGDGMGMDKRRAAELYQKACDMGNVISCDNLGYMYQKGEGVERSHRQAFQLYQKACEGNNPNGCNNLGFMYTKGLGTAKNNGLAAEAYRKACAGGSARGAAMACSNLGYFYQQGKGVEKNLQRAEDLYRKACDGGFEKGCRRLKALKR